MEAVSVKAQVTLKDVEVKLGDMELLKAICNRIKIPTRFLTEDYKVEDNKIWYLEDIGTHKSEYEWIPKDYDQEWVDKVVLVRTIAATMGYTRIMSHQI